MAMRCIFLLVLICLSAWVQAGDPQRIEALGQYSNFRYTEEHQYGAAVELWREGTTFFGLLYYSEGQLNGDPPAGLLEDVSYDVNTGRISFSAKLTTGLHSCKSHDGLPSQDLLRFEGVMSNNSISGRLKHFDNLHQEQAPREKSVVLVRTDEMTSDPYPSRDSWEAANKNRLRFRGAKW